MLDRTMVYNIMYALAALNGREEALFGQCAPLAYQAFAGSLAGEAFPEVWFEIPLAGDPWFDIHVLTSREGLDSHALFEHAAPPFHPHLFEWFANQESGVRQLALSHDISKGCADNPAAQLLVSTYDSGVTCGFLEAAGKPDAARAYRAFAERLPKGWFACYTGVFPNRPDMTLRVECIPDPELQSAYAHDASLLEAHLRQVGFDHFGDTLLARCQALAKTPFEIEFQLDVAPDGTANPTIGASVRFACPPGDEHWRAFEAEGEAGELMQLVESWGLADDRWRLLPETAFAKRMAHQGEGATYFCYPAFLKLRWRAGEPLDAKAYLIAGCSE